MPDALRTILRPLASLRLTLAGLLLAIVLIFVGTLAQVSEGLYLAQERYFQSWLVTLPVGGWSVPVLPGGRLLGWVLVANLLAAHALRFRAKWSQIGIHCIHFGLVLLIVGQLLADAWSRESRFTIEVGKTATYSESPREAELVLVSADDREIRLASSELRPGRVLRPEGFPYELRIRAWHPNASVERERSIVPEARGAARQLRVDPKPRETRLDRRDLPVAEFELIHPASAASLGWWIAPLHLEQRQRVVWPGVPDWEFQLRPTRREHPFRLTLDEFIHERYPGTDTPKRFESRLRLEREGEPARPVTIHMNHPLRIAGRTIYQASFADDDRVSILQVVENPVWVGPYAACGLVVFGLLWHFGARLRASRAPAAPVDSPARGSFAVPVVALVALTAFAAWQVASMGNLATRAATLPVQAHGRIQPMEQLARDTLLLLSGRDRLATGAENLSAIDWLWRMVREPDRADTWPTFEIRHPDLLTLIAAPDGRTKRFSFAELRPHLDAIRQQATAVADQPDTDPFRRAVLRLDNALHAYVALRFSFRPLSGRASLSEDVAAFAPLIPAALEEAGRWQRGETHDAAVLRAFASEGSALRNAAKSALVQPAWPVTGISGEWLSLPGAMLASAQARRAHPAPALYAGWIQAGDEKSVAAIEAALREQAPAALRASRSEALFARLAPFSAAGWLFGGAMLCALASIRGQRPAGATAARALALLAFVVLTAGLVARAVLMQRPPVTNLHSSALVVAWAAALLGLLMERRARTGWAVAGSSAVAGGALVIAAALGAESDPMGVLIAVLNSNFWLATHVLAITVGYGAAFVAGFLGLAYLLARAGNGGSFSRHGPSLSRGILGALGVTLFFTFTGTVLGGIWADQSWGRFWGWDPKENGALLIVLWTAIILHGRLSGSLRETGVAVTALLGNIVVAFSWFGTNLLGIGLHSYGFTERGFLWLCAFMISQLVLATLGWAPARKGRALSKAELAA